MIGPGGINRAIATAAAQAVPGHHHRMHATSALSSHAQPPLQPADRYREMFLLLRGLLSYDANNRTTAEEAYNHPFFTEEHPLPCKTHEMKLDMGHSYHSTSWKKRKVG